MVQQAHRCAQSFAGLVELTKKHKTRNQLLGTALKNGGGFVDVMAKASDFWYAYYIAYGKPFQQLVKTVQKGTKIMQVRPSSTLTATVETGWTACGLCHMGCGSTHAGKYQTMWA